MFDLWTNLERMKEWTGGVSRVSDVSGRVARAGTTYIIARIFATGSYRGSFRGELNDFVRLAEREARVPR